MVSIPLMAARKRISSGAGHNALLRLGDDQVSVFRGLLDRRGEYEPKALYKNALTSNIDADGDVHIGWFMNREELLDTLEDRYDFGRDIMLPPYHDTIDEEMVVYKYAHLVNIGSLIPERIVFVELRIPRGAEVVMTNRKCRASKAVVRGIVDEDKLPVEVDGDEFVLSATTTHTEHDDDHTTIETVYRSGETVEPHEFDPDTSEVCSGGIHFYETLDEAVSNAPSVHGSCITSSTHEKFEKIKDGMLYLTGDRVEVEWVRDREVRVADYRVGFASGAEVEIPDAQKQDVVIREISGVDDAGRVEYGREVELVRENVEYIKTVDERVKSYSVTENAVYSPSIAEEMVELEGEHSELDDSAREVRIVER